MVLSPDASGARSHKDRLRRRSGEHRRRPRKGRWQHRERRVGDHGGGEASELLALLCGVAGRLDNLEESQTKLEQRLEPPKKDAKALMNTSLFESALGRGSRMHIDSLSGTPHTQTPRRPTAPPQYFGLRHADVVSHEPGYGMSELQRLYAAEHAAQAGQGAQPPPAAPTPAPRQPEAQPPAVPTQYQYLQQNQGGALRYPDARQKKLAIRP
ncbi:hypothetical protein PR002_g29826, partial [Phytophthora rubi]